jgi:hypothetical protein
MLRTTSAQHPTTVLALIKRNQGAGSGAQCATHGSRGNLQDRAQPARQQLVHGRQLCTTPAQKATTVLALIMRKSDQGTGSGRPGATHGGGANLQGRAQPAQQTVCSPAQAFYAAYHTTTDWTSQTQQTMCA